MVNSAKLSIRVLPSLAKVTATSLLALVIGAWSPAWSAEAITTLRDQSVPPGNSTVVEKSTAAESERMLVEADQSIYDKDSNTVTLIGRVQIYYKRNVLQAKKVIYYQSNNRVVAEGSVRLTEPGGNVIEASKLDVTKGFQVGFIESLRVDSTDRTQFVATHATRQAGNVTVFENGVYTACQSCAVDAGVPPFWQIKASKIIHNQQEKTVYYEDARLEFAGVPIAYVPFFQHPDPTVTHQTGFLLPTFSVSSKLGASVGVPFFWAPSSDWDVTLQPQYMSKQGFLGDVKVRHSFDNGTVSVRVMAINQQDPSAFVGTSGDRGARGAIFTTGQFNINEQWKWGWDGTLLSDRRFMSDYHLNSSTTQEATSQVYLTGMGERTYFDARAYAFQIFTDDDPTKPRNVGEELQNKQPIVETVDYDAVFGQSFWGGEVSAKFNITNVTRHTTDLDVAGQTYGIAGDFSRASFNFEWRRQFIDSIGEVFTPFASLRGDLFFNNKSPTSGVDWQSDTTAFRAMPAIGMEYRYPFIAASAIGTQIFEPIAQIIVRPNETLIGKLPNEDAQSIVFDDTTLFQTDKFSGYDRAEGGTRANLGLQYTLLMPGGAYASALFGQSYQLAGTNSFDQLTLSTLEYLASQHEALPLSAISSGLGTTSSDYVARINLDTGAGVRFGSSARFSEQDFTFIRNDLNVTALFGPLTTSLTWAYLKTPQSMYDLINSVDPTLLVNDPNLLPRERSELQGSASLKLTENWRVFGGARYDLKNSFLVSDLAGIGYDNDSFSVSLTYSEDTSLSYTQPSGSQVVSDRIIYLKFGLRTLGDGAISNSSAVNSTK